MIPASIRGRALFSWSSRMSSSKQASEAFSSVDEQPIRKLQDGLHPPRAKKRRSIELNSQRILEDVRAKLSLTKKLRSACDELSKVASEVMESPHMSKILKECSHEVTVLTMIAYLGYGAYFGAQHAAKLVPKSYNKYRNSVVFEIMNS